MSPRKSTAGDTLFTIFGAGCAVLATLVTLWIGKSIARGMHGGAHEPASAESSASEPH